MSNKSIIIRGARENNLKDISLEIPRDKFTVITGLSGSGKSSLAFDTIYAEGHRRFVESLSSYARMFIGQLDKPDVDYIEGLSPCISIDQKTTSKNPRSTVGTVTEIYDYLRLLYARVGVPHCPVCGKIIKKQTIDEIIDKILSLDEGTRFYVLAPIVKDKKGTHSKLFENAKKSGFVRVRVDGIVYNLDEEINLDKNNKHSIEIIVDRLVIRPAIRTRLTDSVENAIAQSNGNVSILTLSENSKEYSFSMNYACEEHKISFMEMEPRMFSFNNPIGACPVCLGLGDIPRLSVERMIPDKSLSLSEGAIQVNGFKTLDDDSWNGPLFEAVGKKHGFTLNTPLSDFSDHAMDVLLNGDPDNAYYVKRTFDKRVSNATVKFDGLIGIINNRIKSWGGSYYDEFIDNDLCPECKGARLNKEMSSVTVGGKSIFEFCSMQVGDELNFLKNLVLDNNDAIIAREIIKEITKRLEFLISVGLDYITLSRKAGTLSGGEAQRIRLATQIGSSLMGVIYILDEPSIGLHQRDNIKLINTLKNLRDVGNTVLVVEHDEETMEASDYIVDIGPEAGIKGGEVVFCGTPEDIKKCENSITGAYLSGREKILIPDKRREGNGSWINVRGARENNLKNISVDIPLGKFVCVTGVSGSGKSSLVNNIVLNTLLRDLNKAYAHPGDCDSVSGYDSLDKVIAIDQSPIGRTPRSNPATYTGLFNDIRELFAQTPDAKMRGYSAGRFSFNTKGGRCEDCMGDGVKCIEMNFLPDVYVVCDTCKGKRYNRETLEVKYKGKTISDVLEMSVDEGIDFFESIPKIYNRLKTLKDVGLGYIKIGQSSTTLSGGEAQRVKLAAELSKRSTGRTMYILDEPTTGLHTHDVKKLIGILNRLVDSGNSIIVIEHNLNVIKTADYIIDLGPEGGDMGGTVIAFGTPEQVAACENSYTGKFLKRYFI